MKSLSYGWLCAPALLLGAVRAEPAAAQQGLIRISPAARIADAGEFKPAEWRAKLESKDLDQREQDFEALAARARRDANVRAELEKWAREGDGEIAWTARLLLREVDHRSGASAGAWGAPGRAGGGLRWFDDASGAWPDMQRFFDDMEGDFPGAFFTAPQLGTPSPTPGAPVPPIGGSGTAAQSRSQQFQMSSGPDGVSVTIIEDVDGKTEKKEYKAESMEKLLDEHPELKGRIGLMTPGQTLKLQGTPFDFHLFDDGMSSTRAGGRATAPRTDVLGVTVRSLPSDEAKQLGLDDGVGLVVERTEPNSIAGALGVQRGHVLIEMNGRKLKAAKDITDELCQRPKDGEIKLEIIDRWGQHRTRTWKPATQDSDPAAAPVPADDLRKI